MKNNLKLLLAVGIFGAFTSLSFQNCAPTKMTTGASSDPTQIVNSMTTLKAEAPATYFGVKRLVKVSSGSPTTTQAVAPAEVIANLASSPETSRPKATGAVPPQLPASETSQQVCTGCKRNLAPKLISVEYSKVSKSLTVVAQDVMDYDYLEVLALSSGTVLQVYDLNVARSTYGKAAILLSQNGNTRTYLAQGTDYLVKNGEANGFKVTIYGGRLDSQANSNPIVVTDSPVSNNPLALDIRCNKSEIQCGETFSCYAIGSDLIGTMKLIKPENVGRYVADDPDVLAGQNELVAAGWKKVNPSYYTYESAPIREPKDITYALSVASKGGIYSSGFIHINVKKCDPAPAPASCSLTAMGSTSIPLHGALVLSGSLNYSGSREGMKVKWIGTNQNALTNNASVNISEEAPNWDGGSYPFEDINYAGYYVRALQFLDKNGSVICTTNSVSASFVK